MSETATPPIYAGMLAEFGDVLALEVEGTDAEAIAALFAADSDHNAGEQSPASV